MLINNDTVWWFTTVPYVSKECSDFDRFAYSGRIAFIEPKCDAIFRHRFLHRHAAARGAVLSTTIFRHDRSPKEIHSYLLIQSGIRRHRSVGITHFLCRVQDRVPFHPFRCRKRRAVVVRISCVRICPKTAYQLLMATEVCSQLGPYVRRLKNDRFCLLFSIGSVRITESFSSIYESTKI